MSGSKGKVWLAAAALSSALVSVPVLSHFDDEQVPQSYRQSYFALLAANFGPMVAAVKGEIPWDQVKMENWANDLAALSTLDIMRGFVDGSDKGTTRAKPEIWQDKADFTSKMETLHKELASLQQVTAGGDKAAIGNQVAAAGKACKSCHDDYKAENYLY
ncbi:MAG: cytochrome c [Pseudomonadales bacterium]|nr:cytochrome c [Halioglobus sp.]MCP5123314.1 cytochrome c [Pseudomonadales bacterium]MCP5192964.1 cytochrome c [Pseudomonadales bacterium]